MTDEGKVYIGLGILMPTIVGIYLYNKYKKRLAKDMNVSSSYIKYLKNKEILSLTPYKDDDIKTPQIEYSIGYGHQIQPNEQYLMSGINEIDAENILKNDLIKYENGVKNLVSVPITQGMLDSLVDFCYNVGINAFQNSTLRSLINSNAESYLIQNEFRKWTYTQNVKSSSLISRREDEIKMYFA